MRNRRQLAIDALPLLLQGGISNYTRPIVEHLVALAGEQWQVDLIFRITASWSRLQSYRRYHREHDAQRACHKPVFMPDRWITRLWENGCFIPLRRQRESGGVFLATTDLVPALKPGNGGAVGWILHDLIPLKTPEHFNGDVNVYARQARERAGRADFIVAISETTRKDIIELLNYPEERIVVIYAGIAEAAVPRAGLPLDIKRPYLLYIGGLARHKNVDGMLRIFARCVHEHGLDYDIVLTGKDFRGPGYWESLVRELGIGSRVHITGWISDDERNSLLAHARMLWQFSWYEGFGRPVLEAAAMGVPVLYTSRGAVKEILMNPGQEIDPADEAAAARKAATALTSEATLEEWGKLGRARALKFRWPESARKLLQWIENRFG
jgi:glycosyltransferase involved in cell wall biosynthesis